jgi:hypothetical protein
MIADSSIWRRPKGPPWADALRVAGLTFVWLTVLSAASLACAHGVQGKDAAFVAASNGPQPIAFLYLGAKHMITGYDHLLFLLGVIFFLRRMKDVAIYVSLFSLGHSLTLLAGVLGQIHVNPFLVDAVIGLSVAYKAFDNLGGFRTTFGIQPDLKLAVLGFGLIHGFGLATKLQALNLSPDGLLSNMIAFNVGVELGQLLALSLILGLVAWWRSRPAFDKQATLANGALMSAGFLLVAYQLAGFFRKGAA